MLSPVEARQHVQASSGTTAQRTRRQERAPSMPGTAQSVSQSDETVLRLQAVRAARLPCGSAH